MVLSAAKGKVQDYLQDAAMDALLRNTIIYNVAWEDPRIDCKLLGESRDGEQVGLGPEDRLLMLTTGGCNVLDRLLDGVGHIVSVDLNPSQNALLELRLAAARACTHEQFFQLFAHSNRRLYDALYPETLRPLLSPSAQAFWDSNAGGFFDDFFYAGASGGLARILCWLTWLFGLQPLVRALLTCRTVDEQCKLWDAYEGKINRLIRCFDMLLPAFCPLAGVPASQLRLCASLDGEEQKETSVVRVFLERVFRNTHIAGDNYFWYAYLFGKYSRQCCPRYLHPENFEALKQAAGRVTIKTKLLHEAANEYPDGYFTGMILLDHMDWLSEEQIQQEWGVFCKKLNPESGRVLWRSFSVLQRWPMLKFLFFNPTAVNKAEKETPDRVGMYNSTHLARLPPGLAICEPPPPPPALSRSHERLAFLRGLIGMVEIMPLVGGWMGATLAALSGSLFTPLAGAAPEGRNALLRMLPGLAGGTWVDLGAGLADGLRLGGDAVRMYSDVHLVHFGEGGAAAAAEAAPPVKLHEHAVDESAHAADVAASIGVPCGSADLVTISHSLVADSAWGARLGMATSLLKPGGLIAVTDLAQPAPPSGGIARRAICALRTAFWSAARPRGDAPHSSAVLRELRAISSEVHLEEADARLPLFRSQLQAAHFIYVGRVPE